MKQAQMIAALVLAATLCCGVAVAESDTACIVRHIKDGIFKKECRSIKADCDQKQCPGDTVCGLDLDENITCFDASVKEFENCGPESFRLQQPCPADAGIRGFGMGCTFCRGGNPFIQGPIPTLVGPPTPTPGPSSGQTTMTGLNGGLIAVIVNYMLM